MIYFRNYKFIQPKDLYGIILTGNKKIDKNRYNLNFKFNVLNQEKKFNGTFQINTQNKYITFSYSIVDSDRFILIDKNELLIEWVRALFNESKLRILLSDFPLSFLLKELGIEKI